MYGEDLDVIRRTATAAVAMRGEHSTWILDDGSSDAVRDLAADVGAWYVRREDHSGAKAGNVCRDVYAVQGLDMLGRMQVIFAETEACAAACGTAHAQDASSDAAVAGPAPMDATRRGERRMPFAEIREWIATLPEPGEAGNVRLRVWCRLRHPLPAGGAWCAAALTYIAISHTPVAVETGRTPAEAASFEPGSGEFSMRFHRGSFDVNDWMLLDSAITRSMTRRYSVETNIFSRSGVLVATSLGKNSR